MKCLIILTLVACAQVGCGITKSNQADSDVDSDVEDSPCETGEGCRDCSRCISLTALMLMQDIPCPDGCPGICGCVLWGVVDCREGEMCMERCVVLRDHAGTEAQCRDRPADPMIGRAYDGHWYIPDFSDPHWDVCTPPDAVTALDAPSDPILETEDDPSDVPPDEGNNEPDAVDVEDET